MEGYCLQWIKLFLISIIAIGIVQSYLQMHTMYDVIQNAAMIPNDGTTLIEIPCRSNVEGIATCMHSNGCYAINRLGNGYCQLVTNFLTSTFIEAAAPISFICKYDMHILCECQRIKKSK